MAGQFPSQGQGQGQQPPNGMAGLPGSAAALMQGMGMTPANANLMGQQGGGGPPHPAAMMNPAVQQQLRQMQQLQQQQGGPPIGQNNPMMGGGGAHALPQQAQAQQALLSNAWSAMQRGQSGGMQPQPRQLSQGQGMAQLPVAHLSAQGMAGNVPGQMQPQTSNGMDQQSRLLMQQQNLITQLQRQLQQQGGGGVAMPQIGSNSQPQNNSMGQQGGINVLQQQQQQQQPVTQSQSPMGGGRQQQPGQQHQQQSSGGAQLPPAMQAVQRGDSFGHANVGLSLSRQITREDGLPQAQGQMRQGSQGRVPSQIQLQPQPQQQHLQQLNRQMQGQHAQVNARPGQAQSSTGAVPGQTLQGLPNAQALQQAQGSVSANSLMRMLQTRAAPNPGQPPATQASVPIHTPSQQVVDAMRRAASSAGSARQASVGSHTPQPPAPPARPSPAPTAAQNQHRALMAQMLQRQMARQTSGQGGGPAAVGSDPRARQVTQAKPPQRTTTGGGGGPGQAAAQLQQQQQQLQRQLRGLASQPGASHPAAPAAAPPSAGDGPVPRRDSTSSFSGFLMGVAPDPLAGGVANEPGPAAGGAPAEPAPVGSNAGGGGGKDGKQSFLDGHFAGGWQSNVDLPERRRIIFSIIKVIERMRPDANQLSQNRLPLMAKKLEEHLYRSAHTRDDYVDPASLKRRLHVIAKGIGMPREEGDAAAAEGGEAGSTAGSAASPRASQPVPAPVGSGAPRGPGSGAAPAAPPPPAQVQLAQLQRQMARAGQAHVLQNAAAGMPPDLGGGDPPAHASPAEKTKTILLQQQRRLVLLRHASKCPGGASCPTKFCPQMRSLWKHMKKCRDKTCGVSHCLSSRCVLNHYRMCKSQGQTASCAICGPVMKHIKQSGEQGGDDLDTLTMSVGDSGDVDPLDAAAIGSVENGVANEASGADVNISGLSSSESLNASSVPANPPDGQAAVGVPNNQAAADVAPSQQGQQDELQNKQILLEQVQQQQGNLLGQSQRLQQQLLSASNPEQAEQLQKQSDIVQQLNQQFVQQRSVLQTEIATAMRQPASEPKRSSDLMSTDAAQPKESDDSLRPNKMPRVGDVASPPTKSDTPDNADGADSKPSSKKGPLSEAAKRFAEKFRPLVARLIAHDNGWVFKDPVDPIELGIPEYFEVVENPSDLTLVMNKLDDGVYKDVASFERDTKLVFENAILFNGEDSDVGGMAKELLGLFATDLKNALNGRFGVPSKMPPAS